MIRPIPKHSTDLLYKADFEQQDLEDVARALGLSDLKVVTKATMKPERVLYHACLNGIQTYVKLTHTDEVERAKEIAGLVDTMYASLIGEFNEKLNASQADLERKEKEATHFCQQIHEIESKKEWNQARYSNTWNVENYPPRWQKKAIQTYGLIRDRIAKGEYELPPAKDASDLTTYWSLRNLEYKHHRDAARGLVENYIQENFSQDKLLTMHPANNRVMTMFIGGMGSGKSTMTEHYLESLPEDVRQDTVLHNADYLKYPLYQSAVKDGLLPDDHQYLGEEVQAESSNALYEGTRKRGYLARQRFEAPNVILNSLVLGLFETQEGIASGGKVVAHHVLISPEDAIKESEARRQRIGRAPGDHDIRWSSKASADSLLLVTRPEYKGADITVHLYQRQASKAPRHYATIDVAQSKIHIYDKGAFETLAHTTGESHLSAFEDKFKNAGFDISYEKTHAANIGNGALYATR